MYRPRFWSYAAGLARIHIDIPSRTLAFYYSGRSYGPYPLGLGKPSTPTPQGDWGVADKDPDPWWEVLGSRWMGLDIPWGTYGIHGTNMDWSIGGYVSNGCIRMHNWDVEAIYPLVVIGTPVVISGAYPAQYQGEYWWQAVQRKKEERRANRRSARRMMSAK